MSIPTTARPAVRVPGWLAGSTTKLEHNRRLDVAAKLVDAAGAPLSSEPTGAILRGDWLGHALHPLLTDLSLGCWLSAGLLDVVGGRSGRGSAQRLIGLGLLTVPPTVAAGLVDARGIDRPHDRRVA